ncbi:MAG: DUF2007 domain-containing protein [Ichthyobacteriaceae bacterium]|nr:DUF2007 domain-containing protein [Ichthyobacteriaceae bacterium]
MEDNLITFKVYNTIIDAHIAGSKLESEGIKCYYVDENISSIYPMLATQFGVRLQIKHSDLMKAQTIIEGERL